MSNYAITTKMNIYIPMKEDIINKWGTFNHILEEGRSKTSDKYTKEFTFKFLEEILKETLKTKSFSYLPLIYGVNEDSDEEFKILVVISFEPTYSGLCISNDKLVEMETYKFYDKLINVLERNNCQYQIYDSALL